MKIKLLSLLVCLICCVTVRAEVKQANIGYYDGQPFSKAGFMFFGQDEQVSAAIYMAAGTMGTYRGNEIAGVRVGLLSTRNVDCLTVWLRTALDGENLAEATIEGDRIVEGWHDILFQESWRIPADLKDGLYIGYTYHQKDAANAQAKVDEPMANAYLVKVGNSAWEDISSSGMLCVEGIVRGENWPQRNLFFYSADMPEIYGVERGALSVSGAVRNMAAQTITGFDVSCEVDGVRTDTRHVDATVEYKKSIGFDVVLHPGIDEVGDGKKTVKIVIDNLNGGSDEDMTDNEVFGELTVVRRDYERKVLIEEFTSEYCSNCPRMIGYIKELTDMSPYKEQVVVVAHHSGYQPDWLTTSFDEDYLWLYAGDYIFAPAVMVDRRAYGGNTAVFSTNKMGLEAVLKESTGKYGRAYVSVEPYAGFDSADPSVLYVDVKGTKSIEHIADDPHVTVWLVENDIPAHNQKGGGQDFIHRHVNRAVNASFGEPIKFDGDDYSYSCKFILPADWNRDNMYVVASIGNYNGKDRCDCEVLNTESFPLKEAGIVSVVSSEMDGAVVLRAVDGQIVMCGAVGEIEVYTPDGRRVTNRALSGIYVVRARTLNGEVVTRKMAI